MKKVLAIGFSQERLAKEMEHFVPAELICKEPKELQRPCDFDDVNITLLNTQNIHIFERHRIVNLITDRRSSRGKREASNMDIRAIGNEEEAIKELGSLLGDKRYLAPSEEIKRFILEEIAEDEARTEKKRRLAHFIYERCIERFPDSGTSIEAVSKIVSGQRILRWNIVHKEEMQAVRK